MGKQINAEQASSDIARRVSKVEVLLLIVTTMGVVVAGLQAWSSYKANTIAATALEASAAGDEANKKTAEALERIAIASKEIAVENTKTAAIAERSLKVADDANVNAGRAAKAAEDSNLISVNTAKRDQRAYLTLVLDENPQLRPYAKNEGFGYRLELKVENSGKTPAHNVRTFAAITLLAVNFAEKLDVPELNGTRSSVGPGRRWTLLLPRPLTAAGQASINAKTHAILIHGVIQYDDVFGEHHETSFQLSQNPPGTTLLIDDYGNRLD